jgi:alpha-galactosidase
MAFMLSAYLCALSALVAVPGQIIKEAPDCAAKDAPVFSFRYDGKDSADFLRRWDFDHTSNRIDDARTSHVNIYTDPETKLTVRLVATVYDDFPAIEWLLYIKNNGEKDTPILEDIQALDARLAPRAAGGDLRLFYSLGSRAEPKDFAPQEKMLDTPVRLAPKDGSSSDGVLPFFNLTADKSGIILGIGWTGQWAASFEKSGPHGAHVTAGMEHTRLRLHPGEEIRTPAVLLLFWRGKSPIDGHNQLRRLLLKHYTPMPNGRAPIPPLAASPHGTIGFTDSSETNMLLTIGNIASHKFPVDTYWIDAGWNGVQKDWARSVGTWTPNAQRYPNGMKPVADAAHAHGMRFLLWLEPERVMPDTWLYDNHREWLLRPADLPKDLRYQDKDGFHLLDLGNPDALAWLKATYSNMIGELGIDIYRQDFNMTPLYFWRNGEPEDRQGIREIRHVTGLYDFYDTLMREHPGLLIDNCASGGRRIDFEIIRRALSLFRSDCCWEPIGEQGMNYGISYWLPITGVGAVSINPYDFRSGMGSHMSLALDYSDKSEIWDKTAEMLCQYQSIRHLFTADFYPLTPYSLDRDKWIAWQYHSPELGEGIIQAFRRDTCRDDCMTVKPSGLLAGATYEVSDLDTNERTRKTGRDLMRQGITIHIPTAPGAALVHYSAK